MKCITIFDRYIVSRSLHISKSAKIDHHLNTSIQSGVRCSLVQFIARNIFTQALAVITPPSKTKANMQIAREIPKRAATVKEESCERPQQQTIELSD